MSSSHLPFALPNTSQLVDPTQIPYPDLPHGSEDPFLIRIVDRFRSIPFPMYVLLKELLPKPHVIRTMSHHLKII
ncbi:unnamed protein product [Protopolystoma xenopodis]|uniref:Uncharacterized protein n=1 Tax=Protopolystoma xenopodis TaxID=117903 RepID=A0A3S5BDK4_9PLAT|nr:unnamed protein product [Protopolystoma xenopodis]